ESACCEEVRCEEVLFQACCEVERRKLRRGCSGGTCGSDHSEPASRLAVSDGCQALRQFTGEALCVSPVGCVPDPRPVRGSFHFRSYASPAAAAPYWRGEPG